MKRFRLAPQIIPAVDYDKDTGALLILDQTLLPNEEKVLRLTKKEEIWHAINILQVRGAPAIGIAAALGLAIIAKQIKTTYYHEFIEKLQEAKAYLASSRPTAVNLFWALNRLEALALNKSHLSVEEVKEALLSEALAMLEEDVEVCRKIGEYGLTLLQPNMGILTHCNAGQLATILYGTALAPVYLGQEKGYNFRLFADETRPLLQGARLTAYELTKAGVDTTLICDNMAATVMKNGWIQAILVGCDRVAANGDAANKIGTLGVAILAKYYNIPFYVCAPTSTIDMATSTGSAIHIEERDAEEVSQMWYKKPMAPPAAKIFNPAFDVTDSSLISAIITEKGIVRAPYHVNLKDILKA
ncbi:MAG: S-methyl-5-thioribose-1-phosphate isomerase [Bacillota bacterium]|jgi:methylthioribose-1-phosphate isomerase